MSTNYEHYTRRQGEKLTYSVEYTSLRYRIMLDGKVLKAVELPLDAVTDGSGEVTWKAAVADIEYLRGMAEM